MRSADPPPSDSANIAAVALSSTPPRDAPGLQLRRNLVRTLARAAARELWLTGAAEQSKTASAAPHGSDAGDADR